MGVTTDSGLAKLYAHIRTLRLADGPDEVHCRAIARLEMRKYMSQDANGRDHDARATSPPRTLSPASSRSRSAIVSTRPRSERLDGRAMSRAIAARLRVAQFKGGQSNPDLSARHAETLLRAATQADGQTAAFRSRRSIANFASSPRCIRSIFPWRDPMACVLDDGVIGSAFYIMDMVEGRVFWNASLPELAPAERGQVYRSEDLDARASASDRSAGDRAGRLRQAGQLFHAADRALVEAISRVGDQGHRRDGSADRIVCREPRRRRIAPPSSTATIASTI